MSERKPIEFDLFSDRHLLDLAQQVATEIRRRQDAARQLVKERGGLVEGESPLYRNPTNGSQTWSGRGRQPHRRDRKPATAFAYFGLRR